MGHFLSHGASLKQSQSNPFLLDDKGCTQTLGSIFVPGSAHFLLQEAVKDLGVHHPHTALPRSIEVKPRKAGGESRYQQRAAAPRSEGRAGTLASSINHDLRGFSSADTAPACVLRRW